jgi:hypothetical protein
MKALKKIGFVIASLAVLFLVVTAFVDGEYHVVRSIEINKSQATVYDYLQFLKNQDEFSVWQQMDPNMKRHFKGTDGTVGFVAGWTSKNEQVGVGEQEILKMDGSRIDYEFRFKEPFEATDLAYMEILATGPDKSKVNWGFDGKMPYPSNFFMLFMNMDEMLGPNLESGLANLKEELE